MKKPTKPITPEGRLKARLKVQREKTDAALRLLRVQGDTIHQLREELRAAKARTFEEFAGEFVGSVGVDSGQILVADPCYVDDGFTPEEYKVACTASDGEGDGPMCGFVPLPKVGAYARAFCTSTRDGDGHAEIYVKRDSHGRGPSHGRRPKRITIILP